MTAPILPTTQEGANELVQHMAADPDFGFYIASVMRHAGRVEVIALLSYIWRIADKVNAAREQQV